MTLPFTGFVVPSGGSGGGSGDVTGPGSSTDNAIARFDGAGGKTLQDSGILVTDAAQLSWEGVTADDFETTLGVTDPTADRTITLPDASGNLVVGSTGATDDAILISDGTGGSTLAASAATLTAAGSLTVPSAQLINFSTDTGIYRRTGGIVSVSNGTASAGSGSLDVRIAAFYASGAGNILQYIDPTGAVPVWSGASGVQLVWTNSATNSWSATRDTGLARNAAGVIRATNGTTGLGSLLSGVLVEANTAGSGAPNVIVANESRTVFTNEGTTAANYHTLPTAVAGYVYEFIVQDADGIRIVANTDDTIRVIDKVTAAAGYIESTTIGSTVRLVSINAVEWFATSIHGVWTDGTFTFDDTGSTSP